MYLDIPKGESIQLEYERLDSQDVEKIYGGVASRCRFEIKINLNYSFTPENLMGLRLEIIDINEKRRAAKHDRTLHEKVVLKLKKQVQV